MIGTMQLVACVGFRSNFEKMPKPVINHIQCGIHCRHDLPFSGISGFRQTRGGARRLKRRPLEL